MNSASMGMGSNDNTGPISNSIDEAKSREGIGSALRQPGLKAAAAGTFMPLHALPVKRHELPESARMASAW